MNGGITAEPVGLRVAALLSAARLAMRLVPCFSGSTLECQTDKAGWAEDCALCVPGCPLALLGQLARCPTEDGLAFGRLMQLLQRQCQARQSATGS